MRKRIVVVVAACAAAAVLFVGVIGMHGSEKKSGPVVMSATGRLDEGSGAIAPQVNGGDVEVPPRSEEARETTAPGSGWAGRAAPNSLVDVPGDWVFANYEVAGITSTWNYLVRDSAENAARSLLPLLEEDGMGMIESGYLDLAGEAWGCVCELPDEAGSLVVTLLPRTSAAEAGTLEARIVVHEVPDWEGGSR